MPSQRESASPLELEELEPILRLQQAAAGAVSSSARGVDTIRRAVRLVRDQMDMDVSFVTGESVSDLSLEGSQLSLVGLRADAPSIEIPVAFSDGHVYGTLCLVPRPGSPSLTPRDLRLLEILAYLLAQQLEDGHLLEKQLEIARLRLNSIVDGGSLGFAFQPIVHLASGAMRGVEALARFQVEPRRTPDVWFDEAYALGMGDDIERIAIRAALSNLPALPPDVYMAVNASPHVVDSPDFAELLARVPLNRVVLEVTEHADIDDVAHLIESLRPLRQRGLRLAVDDAGAGFANLLRLLRLRPDVIKLDGDLVRGVDTDPLRKSLAASLVAFAAKLGSIVIAEGVEREEEAVALRALGVEYGQGFLFSRPQPASWLLTLTPDP